jgi:hypothetical protein
MAAPGTKEITDLITKVGGVLSLVGMVGGGLLWSSTTCTSTLTAGRSCRNVFGEVPISQFGQPSTVELFVTGGLTGAVVGALAGAAIVAVWPRTKQDLFPG